MLLRKFILLLIPLALHAQGIKVNMVPVDTAYSATSVNVAIFRANSVVSNDSIQYVSYYDPEGYVTLAKRRLGSDNWEIKHSQYKGNIKDGHNTISIMVDRDNYLHVAFDHHGSPLHYCRSIEPGSLSLGPLEPMIGDLENDVTYPEFYALSDGNMLFAYRSGASGRGNLVLNHYDLTTKTWHRLHDSLIDGEDLRNAYWQLHVDSSGTMHLSWVWRETWLVETNHDLCYARSIDGGKTWQRTDGTPYSLPITENTAELACVIPQNSELINQTSMSTDRRGNPYIATYWRQQGDSIPQYRLVWHDGDKWNNTVVSKRTTPFSLSGGGTKMIPIARPRMVIDNEENIYYITRDVERNSCVTIYKANLGNLNFTPIDVTNFSVGAWEPSIDTNLWNATEKLHIYVQPAWQGDGEVVTSALPSQLYIFEVE